MTTSPTSDCEERGIPQPGVALPRVPYEPLPLANTAESRAKEIFDVARQRRSVREFSDRPVSRETIEYLVRTASTAPSGAHKQPWRFICISDLGLKREIRAAAEAEEREFYASRASERWLADLIPIGTNEQKPFLESAPWLIVVFLLTKTDTGGQVYYPEESVGIASGLLIDAIHRTGLVTLTHTPSPMRFLRDILNRPKYERPYLLLPVGYPASGATVPAMERKPLDAVAEFYEAGVVREPPARDALAAGHDSE